MLQTKEEQKKFFENKLGTAEWKLKEVCYQKKIQEIFVIEGLEIMKTSLEVEAWKKLKDLQELEKSVIEEISNHKKAIESLQ